MANHGVRPARVPRYTLREIPELERSSDDVELPCATPSPLEPTSSDPRRRAADRCGGADRPGAGSGRRPGDDAAAAVRSRDRRRLRPGQLHAAGRVLEEARSGVGSDAASSEIGKTAEGRDAAMAIITSPENLKKLDRYKEISRRLALAEGLTDEQARALAAEGKAVVWIDGGLHATEVLGAQQLMETGLPDGQPQRSGDAALPQRRHRARACMPIPTGMELVSELVHARAGARPSARRRAFRGCIRSTSATTTTATSTCRRSPRPTNMNRIMYHEWFPQIVYNHHQTGPAGTVLFAPPFRDPFNYNFDPLVPLGIDLVGAAMHSRFVAEGKPGATMRRGASYSTWWNGGLRTTVYFHNMIGLLTETIGNPTPMEIPFVPQRQLPSGDLPFPIAPQKWHFRQSIDYSITANRAVLDVASRYREEFLFNIYRMGRNSIERGSRDNWTVTRGESRRCRRPSQRDQPGAQGEAAAAARTADAPGGRRRCAAAASAQVLRDAARPGESRSARLHPPSDQPDFLTATKFVNALIKTASPSIARPRRSRPAARATRPAPTSSRRRRPSGRTSSTCSSRRIIPNDFPYPGGAADAALRQRRLDAGLSDGRRVRPRPRRASTDRSRRCPAWQKPPRRHRWPAPGAGGLSPEPQVNDSFIAINRLLKAGEDVYWLKSARPRKRTAPGTIYIRGQGVDRCRSCRSAAQELGLSFRRQRPARPATRYQAEAGTDRPVGSLRRLDASGWMRWLFEQYEFPFEVVYPQALDAGNLASKFDVLVFVDGGDSGARRAPTGGVRRCRRRVRPDAAGRIDSRAEFRGWLGDVTVAKTVPQLKKFVEDGGTMLAIGSSTSSPIISVCRSQRPRREDRAPATAARRARSSTCRARCCGSTVDNTNPLAYGMRPKVDVFFDNSPALRRLTQPAASRASSRWRGSTAPSRCAAAGRGDSSISKAASRWPKRRSGKGKLFLFGAGDDLPRPAARHLQVPLQRHLLRQGRDGEDGGDAIADGAAIAGETCASASGRNARRSRRASVHRVRIRRGPGGVARATPRHEPMLTT